MTQTRTSRAERIQEIEEFVRTSAGLPAIWGEDALAHIEWLLDERDALTRRLAAAEAEAARYREVLDQIANETQPGSIPPVEYITKAAIHAKARAALTNGDADDVE